MQAVILAGGKGTRLMPYTNELPKPLVPIGDIPILECALKQLKYFGFTDVILAVNHLAELIMSFVGNGGKWGLNVLYSKEDKPLGTAGPLALIDSLEDNFLVMNGDLLTNLNFKDLYDFHIRNKYLSSVATYKKIVNIDLGVLELNEKVVTNYIEKPEYCFRVSTGIYMFSKKVINYIDKNIKLDLPDLIMNLKCQNINTYSYDEDFEWLDIGRISDYQKAIELMENNRLKFLYEER